MNLNPNNNEHEIISNSKFIITKKENEQNVENLRNLNNSKINNL
jgi:hypothetical protein